MRVETVEMMQQMLATIWQKHIRAWHEGLRAKEEMIRINDIAGPSDEQYTENGHLLAPRVGNPGVFCRKCGKFVARIQHVRLKITSKICPRIDAPSDKWVTQEGLG